MMNRWPHWRLAATLVCGAMASLPALADDAVQATTTLVTVSGAPAPTEQDFTIATAEDLTITLTDLQTPAALTSASIVITQGATIVGQASLASPATSATVTLPGAVGDYVLRVIAAPGSFGVGTFSACVAPTSSPAACIQNASVVGNATLPATSTSAATSTQSASFQVTTGGAYTITYADAVFPVALATAPSLALFQGTTPVAVPVPASPAVLTLAPGNYQLFMVAQADPTALAGLYNLNVSGPTGVGLVLGASYPVGTLQSTASVAGAAAGATTLSVADFQFPAALTSVSALATQGGATLGIATLGTPANFTASAGTVQLWSYAQAGTGAGTYEVDLAQGTQLLSQNDLGVNAGGTNAYAYVTPALGAGSYSVVTSDFQFPAALQSLQYAVAQNGTVLQKGTVAGSGSFTAAAAPAVLLVAATAPTGGNGMFDINVQSGGATPQIAFDQTQGVSASTASAFSSQTLTIQDGGNFDATLTDLQFPGAFSTLALLVSSNGAALGKIYGGGTFEFAATPGTYQLNYIALPGTTSSGVQLSYGLYGSQIDYAPPTVTLSASPTNLVAGANTTLTWTSTDSTSCTGAGGSFAGSQATGTASVTLAVSSTTTFTLTCTGAGGSATASATVTTTAASGGGGGGGGALDWTFLGALGLAFARRATQHRQP